MISHRAALVAVGVAFIAGIIGSLAIRPAGMAPVTPALTADGEQVARIRWRVPSHVSRNLPLAGEGPYLFAETMAAASRGAIRLSIIEPGEMVPVFAITDAVRDRKVRAGSTFLGYDQGKIPASALISAVPFGMEPIEFAAWWYGAGGRELGAELYRPHGIHPILCGLTGPETAGWFRHPIQRLEDLNGLKIRFAGLGGKVLERVGASVTVMPAGEIFPALEKGAIDATEFAQPNVDQALGFDSIAKFNLYPGWHQPSTAIHFVVNLDTWNATSAADRTLLETGCTAITMNRLAVTEAAQGEVIAGFRETGTSAERLPIGVLRELQQASRQVLDENAEADPMFSRILASQRRFIDSYAHWKTLAYLPRDF